MESRSPWAARKEGDEGTVTRQSVRLIERRTREVRLPPDEVAFLLSHARHLVDVVPAFQSGVYRLTPRGFVGWFDTPNHRFTIAPKIPWPNVRMLLGLAQSHTEGSTAEAEPGLLDTLAREFASQLRAVVQTGLVAGYHDEATAGAFLRGKLRAVEQMRDTAARAFPDRFHITESVLDLDTPWNRIPRAIAEQILANPDLSPAARIQLREAALSLDSVPCAPCADADFTAAEAEPRAAHYRPLLELCRLLHDGFAAAQLPGSGTGAFLIDLSHAFERYLAGGFGAELAKRPGWAVEPHAGFPVASMVLEPDILIRWRGQARAVLDAKWKAPGTAPNPADLHQILAYAAITGARHVGLVYPGRRSASREFSVPGQDIRLSLIRLRVVGTVEECTRTLAALARLVSRKVR